MKKNNKLKTKKKLVRKSMKKLVKKKEKVVNEEVYDETDDEQETVEYNADEDEFFDEKNFRDFNTKINFHVFDPDKYKNEIHKEIIIVPNQYRKTSEVMSKFEFTEIVSNRAKQIENGSHVFVDIGDATDPIEMAEMEVRLKKCPLSIQRLISNNIAEVWAVNDMIVLY